MPCSASPTVTAPATSPSSRPQPLPIIWHRCWLRRGRCGPPTWYRPVKRRTSWTPAPPSTAPGSIDVQAVLVNLLQDVTGYLATWEPRLADLTAQRAVVLAGADNAVDDAIELLSRGALLAVPGSGWGQAYAGRGASYAALISLLRDRASRWQERLTDIGSQADRLRFPSEQHARRGPAGGTGPHRVADQARGRRAEPRPCRPAHGGRPPA